MALFQSLPNLKKNFAARYSPWMLIGMALILALAIAVLAVGNTRRERAYMAQNLMERAEALAWAVEAGTRAGMGMSSGAQSLQAMVEETAKQAGVVYMEVTDAAGQRIAASHKEDVGKVFYEPQVLSGLLLSEKSQWRETVTTDGREVFEVYRIFLPLPGFQEHMYHSSNSSKLENCRDCPWDQDRAKAWHEAKDDLKAPKSTEGGDLIIFIGLDMAPFAEALAVDFRNTIISGIIVGIFALGGFMSLFWAQHYRLSRRAVQDTQAFAAEILANMPGGLITADDNGRITRVNSVAASLFAISGEMNLKDIPGIPWEAIMAHLAKGQAVHGDEYVFAATGGEGIPVSLSASRIINEDNIRLGYLYLIEDIRERKRVEEQLRRGERLSALGQMAARVAHEIRNPLSSIKGFARFFVEKVPEGSGREIAFTMMEEVDRLNRVVTELLDFARPSALNLKAGDIREVIGRALRLTEDDARQKGLETSFAAPPDLPNVAMDFEHLTQVFLNLFINAVQAMKEGGSLSVAAFVQGSRVAVTVTDTGCGMAPDDLSRVFTPYYTNKPAGTGLGLAIVLKILEEHGAEIKVESSLGRGSTFTILFPQSIAVQG